jgi:hypothetical protein
MTVIELHAGTCAEIRADGFDAGDVPLPEIPAAVSDRMREHLAMCLAAIMSGATPEELAGYLDGAPFPPEATGLLELPGGREELEAHLGLLFGQWTRAVLRSTDDGHGGQV